MSLASQDRRLSVPPLVHLEGQGGGTLGGGGVAVGVSHPVLIPSSPLSGSAPYSELFPFLRQGEGSLHGEALSLISKGAVELTPLSPGYYSLLFVVWKATGSWRPVIDLSHLNCFVQLTQFKMETNQSVLCAVWRDDWMFSNDLKDTYLQVLIHPDSRRYLQFVADRQVYQFKALCFGLSTAPQVFYQGHCSCVSHLSRHGRPGTPIPGRLVGPSLIQSRSPLGEGQGS